MNNTAEKILDKFRNLVKKKIEKKEIKVKQINKIFKG